MNIVHVTPITKGKSPEQLSYFSAHDLPVGSIVTVPLRKKEVPALVVNVESAQAIKALLRTSRYATRKIRPQKAQKLLTPAFVQAARDTADYFATSTGSVIESYTPQAILSDVPEAIEHETAHATPHAFEKQVLQLPKEERIDAYKTLIRSKFSKKQSVYLCVPSLVEAHALREKLKKGIAKYLFVLDSSATKKQQRTLWQAALSESHPVLIIATPGFLSIPRKDTGLFIVEHELSTAFKQMQKPYIDARYLIEKLASHMEVQLIVADTFVRIATHLELSKGLANELEERARRIRTQSTVTCVDVAQVRKSWSEEKDAPYPVLSPQSLKLIKKSLAKKKRIFVFAARRGIAPHSICNDCSRQIMCHHCNAPMVLHESDHKRLLLCHRCGSSRDAHETCAHCGSWNLVSLGIGIGKVQEYLTQSFSSAKIVRIDADTTKKPKDAHEAIREFEKTKSGAILLGTEMALPYLQEPVHECVVSSLDSLMSIPDFRIEEKLFGLLMTLREQTDDTMLIETSSPKSLMLKSIEAGNVARYTREELKLREQLKYPPYTVLIKITREGTKDTVVKDMQRFVEIAGKYKPRVFSAFLRQSRVRFMLSALIRIPRDRWPQQELLALLRALPPTFVIDVEPERAL